MTDNEIIKALKCCKRSAGAIFCTSSCPMYEECNSEDPMEDICGLALDLINRQKAEIEGLGETRYELACIIDELLMCMADGKETKSAKPIDINEIKSEAVKEFAEKLKNRNTTMDKRIISVEIVDNLVKEMTEVETNQRKEDEGK